MNVQDFERALHASSLVPWENLRRREDGTFIPLKDDSPPKRNHSMVRHLSRCAPLFNAVSAHTPAGNVALAWTIREIRPLPLEDVDDALACPDPSSLELEEARNLRIYANRLLDDGPDVSFRNRALAATCREIANTLEGDRTLIGAWTAAAERQRSIETAVTALQTAGDLPTDHPDRPLYLAFAGCTLLDNLPSAMREAPDLTQELMLPLLGKDALIGNALMAAIQKEAPKPRI